MKGKTVLITGSTSGIGLATAEALAKKGAEIILAGRSEDKLKEAVSHIKEKTGNSALKYYTADFSSQQSIRQLAEQVKRDYTKIDVLLNNAGGVFPEFKLTADGLETTIATNHFGYFLLTHLLLPLVKNSNYARIVNVSSDSNYKGKIDIESFTREKGYFIMKAYGQSKLANILFTFELAEKLKDTHVTVNCLHPGVVKTKIGNKGTQWYANLGWSLITTLMGIPVEKGAETSVYLASSPEVKGVTGKYFSNCKVVEPNPDAYNVALRKQLWEVSEKLCPVT